MYFLHSDTDPWLCCVCVCNDMNAAHTHDYTRSARATQLHLQCTSIVHYKYIAHKHAYPCIIALRAWHTRASHTIRMHCPITDSNCLQACLTRMHASLHMHTACITNALYMHHIHFMCRFVQPSYTAHAQCMCPPRVAMYCTCYMYCTCECAASVMHMTACRLHTRVNIRVHNLLSARAQYMNTARITCSVHYMSTAHYTCITHVLHMHCPVPPHAASALRLPPLAPHCR